MDKLTCGATAFVNCTAEALARRLVDVLPPDKTVLQIPENLELDPKMVETCCKLKESGFRLALLDFNWDLMAHPLLCVADYLKVDFTRLDARSRQNLRKRLGEAPITLLANKIETQEAFRQASTEGFTLFQGYYFCHPELFKNAKVPANRLCHFEILRQLHKDPLELHTVSRLVMRDASLVYRLLRLVNSPIYAMRQEVRSIESAIMVVGEAAFRRIATLAILSELNAGQPPEILHMALVRARFCELAAPLCDQDSQEQYLLGMLSLLPAMLRYPMEAFAPELPLRNIIREALLGVAHPERCLLAWIEAHERNDQAAEYAITEAYGLNQQQLIHSYINAVVWDETAVQADA
jgi:EAL and modified HD-GYP domain-containing signal transduction protein